MICTLPEWKMKRKIFLQNHHWTPFCRHLLCQPGRVTCRHPQPLLSIPRPCFLLLNRQQHLRLHQRNNNRVSGFHLNLHFEAVFFLFYQLVHRMPPFMSVCVSRADYFTIWKEFIGGLRCSDHCAFVVGLLVIVVLCRELH
eukprot:m.40139 g.40139  ORF g.40139 m.40139 type:complete len:141 (+) comp11696_c0_seq2:4777-5199(+)